MSIVDTVSMFQIKKIPLVLCEQSGLRSQVNVFYLNPLATIIKEFQLDTMTTRDVTVGLVLNWKTEEIRFQVFGCNFLLFNKIIAAKINHIYFPRKDFSTELEC